MKYSVSLMLFVVILFNGCGKRPETKIVYVDRVVEKKVPVFKPVPKVTCNFDQTNDSDVVIELYRCLYDVKEVCYGHN